jgi:hypothetical protein
MRRKHATVSGNFRRARDPCAVGRGSQTDPILNGSCKTIHANNKLPTMMPNTREVHNTCDDYYDVATQAFLMFGLTRPSRALVFLRSATPAAGV